MTADELFTILDSWILKGWVRSLDYAFVLFLQKEVPETSGIVLLAGALTSHQLGRGHICLDLKETLLNADDTLSLPPEGELGEDLPLKPSQILAGLDKNVWENELSASSLVACGEGSTPLVLDAGRLYLRRFWDYTRKVAQAVIVPVT